MGNANENIKLFIFLLETQGLGIKDNGIITS